MTNWQTAFPKVFSVSDERRRRRQGRRRVAAYVGVLVAMAIFWVLRTANAEMVRMSLQFGRDLAPLSDLLTEHARVNLNGEHIWAASALSPMPVGAILDRFEAHCRSGGVTGITWGGSGEKAADIKDLVDARDPKNPEITLGVLRSDAGDEGAILCFPKGSLSGSFKEKLNAFIDTRDFGQLGQMRYVYVRRDQDQSHVLTLWTDEHLRLDKLAGLDGSEPGTDHPDLPRPIRSRRIMSTSVDETPYGAHGYLSQAAPEEVLTAYSNEMSARGWVMAQTLDDGSLGFLKDGSIVTIGAAKHDEGTLIGIAELGVDPELSQLQLTQ